MQKIAERGMLQNFIRQLEFYLTVLKNMPLPKKETHCEFENEHSVYDRLTEL